MHAGKRLFSFFLSIYSQCCVLAFLAAQYTTICLDRYDVMLSCWKFTAEDRPNFCTLLEDISQQLQ